MDSEKTDHDNHFVYQKLFQRCGLFQFLLILFIYPSKILVPFNLYFMSFGAYNPGWKCIDNLTSFYDNETRPEFPNMKDDVNSSEYLYESCHLFEKCENIQFNPATTTIASEWGLICNRAWILSVIISIQMAGIALGAILSGYLGDRFGRKWTIFISVLVLGILSLVAMYSVSWQMYAALIFLMGIPTALITYAPSAFIAEYVPISYRMPVQVIPMWGAGLMLFCLCAMFIQNWKYIYLVMVISSFIFFLPSVWVPESFRWLVTNGKKEKSLTVVKKVMRANKLDYPLEDFKDIMGSQELTEKENNDNRYHFRDMFRKKLKITLIFGFTFFSIDLMYFAMSLGVSAFPGNIYVNMIIMSASELPANIFGSFLPNIAGRKKTTSTAFLTGSACFIGVVLLDRFAFGETRVIGIMICVALCKVLLVMIWYVLIVQTSELFPTIVRGTAIGFNGFMGGVGSILAPYLIPTSPDQLYINYIVMSLILTVVGLLMLLLPETKGKPLSDTWGDENIKSTELDENLYF